MIYNFDYLKKIDGFPNDVDEAEFVNKLNKEHDDKYIDIIIKIISDIRNKVAEHCKLDKIIFLFGNGTSLYAGTRTTNNSKIQNFHSENNEINEIIKNFEYKDVEEQLNNLMICHKYYSLTQNDTYIEEFEKLIDSIKSDLLNNNVNLLNYNLLGHHEILFRKFRNMKLLNKINLFTTNYDLAFEYSMDNISIEYTTGFTGFIKRKFDVRSLQTNNKLKLYKIHGSINWEYSDGEILEKQPKFDNGFVISNDSKNDVLIYPTSKKIEETFSAPYSELLREMLNTLKDEKSVVFVLGYKYGDDHINEILFKSLSNPNNIYYFFDYDGIHNDFLKKIEKIEKQTKNIYIFQGKLLASFEFFSDYLFPSKPNETDYECIANLLKKVIKDDE